MKSRKLKAGEISFVLIGFAVGELDTLEIANWLKVPEWQIYNLLAKRKPRECGE